VRAQQSTDCAANGCVVVDQCNLDGRALHTGPVTQSNESKIWWQLDLGTKRGRGDQESARPTK
jgi:hypothetical protein